MNRTKALASMKAHFPNADDLVKTDLNSLVICEKKELLYEEAPYAYKVLQ